MIRKGYKIITIFMLLVMSSVSISYSQTLNSSEYKWLVEPQFDFVKNFSDELALVIIDGKIGYINTNGNFEIKPKFDSTSSFSEGLAAAKKDNKWGFINKKGMFVISPEFDDAWSFSEGLAIVRQNGKHGFINKNGKVVIPLQFREARSFSGGLAAVMNERYWGFIDKNGKTVIDFKIESYNINDFFNGIVEIGGRAYDNNGNILFNSQQQLDELYIISNFNDNRAVIGKFSSACIFSAPQKGYIDNNGKIIMKPQLTEAYNFSDGVARVKNRKWNYIDKNGKVIIETDFDEVYDFSESIAAFKEGKLYGYINKEGKVIIKPQFTDAGTFFNGFAKVRMNNKWGFIKNPLSSEKQIESLKQSGQFIGNIKSVTGSTVIISGKLIADHVYMGDKLCIYSGDKIFIIRAVFPMMTMVKCDVLSGDVHSLKAGMDVYKYSGRIKKEDK